MKKYWIYLQVYLSIFAALEVFPEEPVIDIATEKIWSEARDVRGLTLKQHDWNWSYQDGTHSELNLDKKNLSKILVHFPEADPYPAKLTLLGPKHEPILGPVPIPTGSAAGFGSIYEGELNGDSIDDYIISAGSGGNSFTGGYAILILSQKKQFSLFSFPTINFHPILVRRDNQTKGSLILQQYFVHGPPGKDKKNHNYLVYQVVRVNKKGVKLDNGSLSDFPRWYMLSYKQNSIPTRQLTKKQKEETLSAAEYQVVIKELGR